MWDVEFFKNNKGEVPVEEFLDSISDVKLRAKMVKEIGLLVEFGSKLREPHTKSIKDDRGSMFELRAQQSSNISRVFFFYVKGKKIILLNGFVKKSDKTPKTHINLAYKYKKIYEKRCKDEK
jgi:phage-related protein